MKPYTPIGETGKRLTDHFNNFRIYAIDIISPLR